MLEYVSRAFTAVYTSSRKTQLIAVLCLFLVSMFIGAAVVRTQQSSPATTDQSAAIAPTLELTDLPETPTADDVTSINVLLLGYGGAGHQGGMLSDVIQLASLDFERKTVTLISIPRDLAVTLPDLGERKINRAFSLGTADSPVASGAQVAKQMVQAVTNMPVHYFAAVDFVGFKRLIGQELGGLEVNVEEELNDPWYPIAGKEQEPCGYSAEEIAEMTNTLSGFELEKQFECRYERIYFPVGTHTMHGHEALAFVRSRHGSAGGDFSRSRRQWVLLTAFRDRLISTDALNTIEATYTGITRYVTTDLDLEFVVEVAPQLLTAQDFEIKRIGLSTDNVLTSSKNSSGQYVLYPKDGQSSWSSVHSHIEGQR